MRTANFNTGAPLKTYEIRSAKDQRYNIPGFDHADFKTGDRIELLKTDDINAAMKGVKFEYEAAEIGNTTESPRPDFDGDLEKIYERFQGQKITKSLFADLTVEFFKHYLTHDQNG